MHQQAEQLPYIYKPFLLVMTKETRPSQIVIYGLCGRRFKQIMLPQRISKLESQADFSVIRWYIRKYIRRFNGHCPLWGMVTGFLYSKNPNEHYVFDSTGNMLERTSVLPNSAKSFVASEVVIRVH